MSSTTPQAPWTLPDLARARRAIVVVDVVESVRLMEEDEAGFIDRWRRFVHEVRTTVLPKHGGRMVKSLGDGMLLAFESVLSAVAACRELHTRIAELNTSLPAAKRIGLRAGANTCDVAEDELDVYGSGVNLAARLAALAGAGDIVVTPEVRDALVQGLDADMEDMGECHLRHVNQSVRATRISTATRGPVSWHRSEGSGACEQIRIAVLPFTSRDAARSTDPILDVIADDLIAKLSVQPALSVISRLSSSRLAGRSEPLETLRQILGVNYVVHGSLVRDGARLRLFASLVECQSGTVAWAARLEAREDRLLVDDEPAVGAVVAGVCSAIVSAEVRRAATCALPTLSSYTILLGAVARLHSLSLSEFDTARDMLVYLIERHSRQPTPKAWLALWHVMRVGQGWSRDPVADAAQARALVATALDSEPSHSLSLAVDGLTCAYVYKDFATAATRYEDALRANPNESLAWLFQSALHAYQERGNEAVHGALHAQSLSPIDPIKYYYDNFTSTAMLSAGNLQGAIEFGKRSLRANRMHGPTLRVLAIAHSMAGNMPEAGNCIQQMLVLEPGFTVSRFRDRYPGRAPAQVNRYAMALSDAGLAA